MNAIRRWLSRPAFTRGEVLFVLAAVAVANGVQALTRIDDTVTLLVVVGLVIAARVTWDFTHHMLKRKARRKVPQP